MRSVLSFLYPYRKSMSVAIALMLVELMVELWHPLLMAKIINEGILTRDLSVVLTWGGVMVALSLAGFAAGITNSFFAAHASQGFGFDLRKQLFDRVQSFSLATFNRFPTSTLITRMTSDIQQLQNMVFMGLRIMLRAPLFLIGGLIMAVVVHPRLALLLLVVTPLLIVFLAWMMRRGFGLFRAVQEKLDQTNGVLRENLSGIRLVKAYVREKHEIKRFTRSNEELMERSRSALRLVEVTIPLLLLVMNGSVLLILWQGSNLIALKGASVGDVVAVVNYATRITGVFSIVSMIVMGLSRAKASALRIAEVLDVEAEGQAGGGKAAAGQKEEGLREADRRPARIEFDRVTFRYPDTQDPVLEEVTFTAEPGSTIAILGATGSGKSTLFQLIPRLYEADSGSIRIDGAEIGSLPEEALRRRIGYVPQESILFSGTVRDNLLWGHASATMEEMVEAASRAQIHETIMKLPNQYETVLGQKGMNLSGGQKQRMSIARALIRRPSILLLDDSTSALDAVTEAKLMEGLHRYACTTLLITQKISTAQKADCIVLLEDGRVLASGTHDVLMEQSELYRSIAASQTGEEVPRHA
ncbi:ABC transporter ATP-binding protein [Paenibacillus turpanensis]|uniref:ABC transporter ATP-binding protein n=1 Tax=Paenibacillus turpanensis TaxID=2689078 RepID=UPI0014077966|nr:ABC transporter ATP-binding protein [Paenibacillus turpanensis]